MTRSIMLEARGLTLAASAAGDVAKPALLLLHGWPHARALYAGVIEPLSSDFFVLAPDLPGVGESRGSLGTAEKTVIADLLLTAAENEGAHDIIVAGLDVGGMIAFAAARDHGRRIVAAVVMNTVVPGIEPWPKILADPRIWHFAFHAIPDLPELLVRGHEGAYFDFFHDVLAGDPKRITRELRADFARAYADPEALRTGFDWYRAMVRDAEHNAEPAHITTPLLYVRGDADNRPIEPYVAGLRAAGAADVVSRTIEGSGELLPVEAPAAFVEMLKAWGAEQRQRMEHAGPRAVL